MWLSPTTWPLLLIACRHAPAPPEAPEVGLCPVLPDEAVAVHDLAVIVDVPWAAGALEHAEIGHRARLPEESVLLARRRLAPPNDLPPVVDRDRLAPGATESPEIGDHPVLPDEGVALARGGPTRPDELVPVVDVRRRGAVTTERREVGGAGA